MKSLDKLPTPENLDEVAQNDALDRNKFIANFIRLLASIEGHYSIALDGRWGAGKTFFVKQTERVIKEFYNVKTTTEIDVKTNPQQEVKRSSKLHDIFNKYLLPLELIEIISHHMITFYYDAWQHDNQQDALLSLVFELIKEIPSNNPQLKISSTKWDKIRNGLIVIAEGITAHLSGIDIEKLKYNVNELFETIQKKDNLEILLKDLFENLLPDKCTRLVIFIDELDRCKPDYAVQLLERIKHYMLSDRITFVITLNYEQLQHTIKRYYGNDFEASMYLDKFFDLHIQLPAPNLFKRREAFLFGSKESVFNEWCQKIADEFKFEIREVVHFKELIKHVIYVDDAIFKTIFTEHKLERPKQTLEFLNYYFAPLALGCLIKDINLYYKFIDGKYKNIINIMLKYIITLGFDYICNAFNISCNKKDSECLSEKYAYNMAEEYLHQLYDAVFSKLYIFEGENVEVGNLYVDGKIKQEFIRQISLLQSPSNY